MYQQYFQVMYLGADGDWRTVRDDRGLKCKMGNLPSAVSIRDIALEASKTEALVIRVEEAEVYDPITRQKYVHTTYTGIKDNA